MATTPTPSPYHPVSSASLCLHAAAHIYAGALTLEQYFGGHDKGTYAGDLTPWVRLNAVDTVARVNVLIDAMRADGVIIEFNPDTKQLSPSSSGWRPAAFNAQVKGAAFRSKHIDGKACDLYDPEGALDDWCMEHLDVLERIGLWLEHPSATKGWCHLQTVPPRSGRRVFYP